MAAYVLTNSSSSWTRKTSLTRALLLAINFIGLASAINLSDVTNITSTSWTLLYQNNLNSSDDQNHIGALMTDPLSAQDGVQACKSASETPLTWAQISAHESDFVAQFRYLCHSGRLTCPAPLWIENGVVMANANDSSIQQLPIKSYSGQSMPQLCTQSSGGNTVSSSRPTDHNQIAVKTGVSGNTYVGYRNQKSFRFAGIRFAANPARFTHSQPLVSSGKVSNNTVNAPECIQNSGTSGSEDCLFLNIQTPYLPRAHSNPGNFKPVIFYIHGGALITGSSNDGTTDGSNIAAREDVVVVNVNYRLGTYGFFAAPGTQYSGNYGLGDVISALQWTQTNIAYFGGDSSKITIVGQSAGAALVRALLGSPKAQGLFHGAIAMSNLGGAVDLGAAGDYGTPNTFYYTVAESFQKAGSSIIQKAGCGAATEDSVNRFSCLATTTGLSSVKIQAQWMVQDGEYLDSQYLEVGNPGSVANVPFMTGAMANDGASFTANHPCDSQVECISQSLGISQAFAQAAIDSKLFPYYDTGNVTADSFNVSQRIRTDDTFRCVDQASAYAAATSGSTGPVYYYQNNRGLGGYDPAGVPDGAVDNSPTTPYYRLHSADVQYVFGNIQRPHGPDDLVAMRVLSAFWASFVRSGNPNPDPALLRLRGYMDTWRAVMAPGGNWQPVAGKNGPMMMLDRQPRLQNSFVDVPQCNFLNYSLDYFMVHPKGLKREVRLF